MALSEPIASRDFSGDQSLVKSAVTLYHQGQVETVRIVYHVNGEDIFQRDVSLSQQPESLTLLAEWEAEPDEWIRGQIRVEDARDVLPGDNGVFFSLPPVREGRLGLLSQSTYLRTAFSPDVMRGRWAARLLDPADLPLRATGDSRISTSSAWPGNTWSPPRYASWCSIFSTAVEAFFCWSTV